MGLAAGAGSTGPSNREWWRPGRPPGSDGSRRVWHQRPHARHGMTVYAWAQGRWCRPMGARREVHRRLEAAAHVERHRAVHLHRGDREDAVPRPAWVVALVGMLVSVLMILHAKGRESYWHTTRSSA